MPDKWTFKIKPIAELLGRYVGDGKGWIDPFAGMYSPAEYTNDIEGRSAEYQMDALDFLKFFLTLPFNNTRNTTVSSPKTIQINNDQ